MSFGVRYSSLNRQNKAASSEGASEQKEQLYTIIACVPPVYPWLYNAHLLVGRPSLAVGDAGGGGVGRPARVPVHLLHKNTRDVAAVEGRVRGGGTNTDRQAVPKRK